MTYDDFLSHLQGVKQSGSGATAKCPAHDDDNPSLSISMGDDGKIILHCHAGCTNENIVETLGLKLSDLFLPKPAKAKITRVKIDTIYDYEEPDGTLRYQVIRYDPKGDFPQRRPTGDSHWIWGLTAGKYYQGNNGDWYKAKPDYDGETKHFPTCEPLLYQLPEVIERSNKGEAIVIVEGEKDVLTLKSLGILATCNSGGAGKFPKQGVQWLQGARIAIIPDSDIPGRKHADQVAFLLHGTASEIRIANLPIELNDHPVKDVSDFIAAGGTREQLSEILKAAPIWKPPEESDTPKEKPTSDDPIHLTDTGDARRILTKYGDILRYNHSPSRTWYCWDGKVWGLDKKNKIYNFAGKIARELIHEAADCDSRESRELLFKHARRIEGLSGQKDIIGMLQTFQEIQIDRRDLDSNDHLLNVRNGTIDLKTGELLAHNKDDFITRILDINFLPGTQSRDWNQFLETVLPDPDVRHYIHKAAGYSLTGNVSEEKMFFAYGPSATGKSTFLGAIHSVLGDYAITTDFTSFLSAKMKESGPRADIAGLAGYRFVSSVEVEDGQHMAEGLLCLLTGGDRIRARHLYQDSFEFRPTFKIWLAANNRPDISSGESALWRRLKLIPFDVVIPEEKRDPAVKQILCNSAISGAAVLAWLVEGCILWQAERLQPEPPNVRALTQEYKSESDPLRDFLENCCETNESFVIGKQELYDLYQEWCKDTHDKYPIGHKNFNKLIFSRGFRENRVGQDKIRVWNGLKESRTGTVPEKKMFP